MLLDRALLRSSTLVASPQSKLGKRQIRIQKRLLASPPSFFLSFLLTYKRKKKEMEKREKKTSHRKEKRAQS
jgi:hypothetical protein